jgi:hypothetical protein
MVLYVLDKPFPFQTHLKLMRKLFPLGVIACVTLFEQLVKSGINHLQENILERLHDHCFVYILFYLLSNSHWTCLKSCVGLVAGTWLLTCPIIFFFCLPSDVFSTTLHTRLGHSHHLILGVSHYICNQPWILWDPPFWIGAQMGGLIWHRTKILVYSKSWSKFGNYN